MLKKILLLLLAFLPLAAHADSELTPYSPVYHEKGIVRQVQNEQVQDPDGTMQSLQVEILSGPHAGQLVPVTNSFFGGQRELLVSAGDKVLIYAEDSEQGISFSVRDFWRFDGLIFWILAFILLTWLIARGKGLKGILALALSILIIFYLFIPLINQDYSPMLCVLLVSIFIILVNVPLIHGLNKKSLAISISTSIAIAITILITLLLDHFLQIRGTGTEATIYLQGNLATVSSLPRLFAAGVVLGALGAVMDVCVSIASGLCEITQHKKISFARLLQSGMNIGGDVLGSMLNTLVFAYVGSSLIMLLILAQGDTPLLILLNYSFITEEIVRSLVGAFGLLLAIPLTALISAFLMRSDSDS